jgi:hypothetical protein
MVHILWVLVQVAELVERTSDDGTATVKDYSASFARVGIIEGSVTGDEVGANDGTVWLLHEANFRFVSDCLAKQDVIGEDREGQIRA